MANPGTSAAPAGRVRWRRRLLFGVAAVLIFLVSLHVFGGRVTVTGAAVIGGLALLGFVIYRLPHLRRHFSRGGGGHGPGSLNFPSQVAARQRAKRFSLFRRGGAAGGSGGGLGGGGGRRSGLPRIFRGHRRRSGAGSPLGSAGSGARSGSGGRSRSGIFRRRRGSGSLGGGGGGGGRGRSMFRRGSGRRAGAGGSGGTGARRGHRPLWRGRPARGSTSTGGGGGPRRRTGSGGGRGGPGGGGPRRHWFAPWRRRPTRGSTSTGGGTSRRGTGGRRPAAGGGGSRRRWWRRSRRPATTTGGGPGPRRGSGGGGRPPRRHPVARARWNRANPVNPGYRRWYAPWRRTGAAAAGGAPGPGTAGPGFWRRCWYSVARTPAQRNTRRLARVSRRGRVRAARRRAALNPYARVSRWSSLRRRLAAPRHRRTGQRLGWRARIARRWRSRRGLHRGLGIGGARQVGRPPRPLLAGLRNSPGLRRFAASPLGRGAAWIDRRRADRWLRRQRRYAPAGVMRPAAPRPGTPGHRLLQASASLIPARTPQAGGRVNIAAMVAQIRAHGAHEFTDAQDVHDTVTGMHEPVQAMHEVLSRWEAALAGSGVHPAYADAVREAAVALAGTVGRLQGVMAGGVTRGPGS
jgi:hypothetical protein